MSYCLASLAPLLSPSHPSSSSLPSTPTHVFLFYARLPFTPIFHPRPSFLYLHLSFFPFCRHHLLPLAPLSSYLSSRLTRLLFLDSFFLAFIFTSFLFCSRGGLHPFAFFQFLSLLSSPLEAETYPRPFAAHRSASFSNAGKNSFSVALGLFSQHPNAFLVPPVRSSYCFFFVLSHSRRGLVPRRRQAFSGESSRTSPRRRHGGVREAKRRGRRRSWRRGKEDEDEGLKSLRCVSGW